MERIIDPRLFRLEAAHIDWLAAIRQAGEQHSDALERFRTSQRSRLTCALRWHVAAHRGNYQAGTERGIGLPSGPFQVFRRPSINLPPMPVASTEVFGWPFLLDTLVRRFDDLYGMIRVDVNTPVEATVVGLADPSDQASVLTRSVVPAGGGTIELHGGGMGGIAFPVTSSVSNIVGVLQSAYESLGGWQQRRARGPAGQARRVVHRRRPRPTPRLARQPDGASRRRRRPPGARVPRVRVAAADGARGEGAAVGAAGLRRPARRAGRHADPRAARRPGPPAVRADAAAVERARAAAVHVRRPADVGTRRGGPHLPDQRPPGRRQLGPLPQPGPRLRHQRRRAAAGQLRHRTVPRRVALRLPRRRPVRQRARRRIGTGRADRPGAAADPGTDAADAVRARCGAARRGTAGGARAALRRQRARVVGAATGDDVHARRQLRRGARRRRRARGRAC